MLGSSGKWIQTTPQVEWEEKEMKCYSLFNRPISILVRYIFSNVSTKFHSFDGAFERTFASPEIWSSERYYIAYMIYAQNLSVTITFVPLPLRNIDGGGLVSNMPYPFWSHISRRLKILKSKIVVVLCILFQLLYRSVFQTLPTLRHTGHLLDNQYGFPGCKSRTRYRKQTLDLTF